MQVSLLLTPSESKRDVPVADGDIFVVEIEDGDGQTYLLASFHGDTNGLATIPVVNAVHDYALRAHTRYALPHLTQYYYFVKLDREKLSKSLLL